MRRLSLVALSLLAAPWAAAASLAVPPAPDHRVNDYAGALSPGDRDRLEQKLASAEAQTGNQVVVAIFPSLDGESLEDYSIRVAEAWRVGQKKLDNGVIFLIFVKDRKMRLEVGYGLEPVLTDAQATSILQAVVAPYFRAGNMAAGVGAGVDAILATIAGSYRAPGRPAPRGVDPLTLLLLGFVGLVVLGVISSAIRETAGSRRQGWTGDSTGWGRRPRDIWIGGWPGGGFPGGGGGGGYGGGGFSGGGGSFGGGGASGSW